MKGGRGEGRGDDSSPMKVSYTECILGLWFKVQSVGFYAVGSLQVGGSHCPIPSLDAWRATWVRGGEMSEDP